MIVTDQQIKIWLISNSSSGQLSEKLSMILLSESNPTYSQSKNVLQALQDNELYH